MSAMDLLLLLSASAVAVAYLCRLDRLVMRRHRVTVIAFHVALLVGVVAAGIHAWQGATDVIDVCCVIAAALWIWISLPSWRDGPPNHVSKERRA